MTIINATSQNFHEITGRDLVLLAFWSTWCEPCKMMDTILERIDREMNGSIKIVKKDLYEDQDIATRFDIFGTPTLILLKDDEILGKIGGYHTQEEITDFIQKYI